MHEAIPKAESDSTPDRQGLNIHPLFVKDDEVHLNISLPDGRRWPLRIHSIRFSPPLPNDFLLPQFPLTLALTVASDRTEIAELETKFTLEITGPWDWQQSIPLRITHQEGFLHQFKATFLPPRAGIYRLRVQLAQDPHQSVSLLDTKAEVSQPRPNERWTLGPLIAEVDPYLYLGNAAAAVNPKLYPEDHEGILKAHGIQAVVNAAEERDPEPALLDTGIEYAHFLFRDFSHNPLEEDLVWRALEWIALRAEQKRSVFVHCHAGIGRSGSLVAAYLLLFRYPKQSFDEVVHQINERLKTHRHRIYPHLGLAETVEALRGKRSASREHSAAQFAQEPVGKVHGIAFDSLYIHRSGQVIEVDTHWEQVHIAQRGCPIVLRVRVTYESHPPRGVYLLTNLNQDGPPFEKIPMRAVSEEEGIFEACVLPERVGECFWLTACATPRRYDHDLVATWVGQDLRFQVVEAKI